MKSLFLSVFIILFAFSCSEDDATTAPISAEDSYKIVESSNTLDETINNSIDAFLVNSGIMLRTTPGTINTTLDLPDCTTITRNNTANGLEVVLNFGTGCKDHLGNTHSGIVRILVSISPSSISYTKTFENYKFNGNSVVGKVVNVRTLVNNLSTVNRTCDLSITTTEGKIIKRNANHIITLVVGNTTPVENDNIYSITGNATVVINNNYTWKQTILSAIIRKASCSYQAVQGTQSITKDNQNIYVDYGEGDCDGIAKVTLPSGNIITVNL